MGSETMEEPFDKELELVKLQIVANDCLAEAQIYYPLLVSIALVLWVFMFSIMLQYPSSYLASVMLWMAFGLMCVSAILVFWTRNRYRDGIRKLDEYVENLKARKPLPPLTTLCGVKEKKRISSSCECKASTK
jgi:hypothetical protein